MMENVFLVSENSLKAANYIDYNIKGEVLIPAITFVQDDIVENLLGTKLYEKLLSLINSDTINESENSKYKELLDGYLFKLIAYSVIAELQVPLSYQTRNKGNVQSSDERVSNAFMTEVKYTENHYRNRADLYRIRLSDYLYCNNKDFPELKESVKFWQKRAGSGDKFGSNFYFGDVCGCKCSKR